MKTQTFGTAAGAQAYSLRFFSESPLSYLAPLLDLVREKSGTKWGWIFVPGAFPPKAVDDLRKDDWYKKRFDEARDAYLANRKNGVEGDSPATPFPGDGAYSWDTPESEVESKIRYTEGPQDKAWMEARDRNYVFRLETEGRLDKDEPKLKTEVPSLYAEVMAKRQSSSRGAEEKMAQETQARLAEQARAAQAAAVKREQEARIKKEAEERAKKEAEEKARREAEAARVRNAAKKAEEEAAKKPPAPSVPAPAPPARPVPPLVSQVTKLLQKARQQRLSSEEQEELSDIETYNQHFYTAPLTEEARQELKEAVEKLNGLISRKTVAPPADVAAPAVAASPAARRPASAEEKLPGKPPAMGLLGSDGVISLDISIPFEKLHYGAVLGEGAFGVVYQGTWGGHTDVAIKELKHKQLAPESLQEFKQEATAMAKLNHPHIVRLYGVCLKPAHYGLVMEYLPNVSLFNLLHNGQAIPWSVRHSIVMDITKGMTYLHDGEMVHCDLKSLNVLLDDHLRAKIADFGLAKLKTESASLSKGGGGSRGSLPWMAPELFKRGGKNSKASDMYAYGMVLWEVASRKIPFQDAANSEVMMGWIKDGEKETVPEDCPAELKDVITACWDTPDKRPSMAVALTRLQRWQQPKGVAPISDLFASTQQRKLAPGEAAVAADLSYGGNQGSIGSGLPVRR